MEMDTLGYHAIILNVNVKYCLLNLRFVCFALSHSALDGRVVVATLLAEALVKILMNLCLIALELMCPKNVRWN